MTLHENLKALLKAKPENREALMGKLMKEQAPKNTTRKNPYVISEQLTPFQEACFSQLSERPQSASQIAHKLNGSSSNVGATLAALAAAGRVQRDRVAAKTPGNFYWVFWK